MRWFLRFRRRLMARIGGVLVAVADPNLIVRNHLIDKPEFQNAFDAFDSGSLLTAFGLFQQLAEMGDSAAQNNLGILYESGVPYRDDAEAEKWYRKAANQGLAESQYNIAAILAGDAMGEHTQSDDVEVGGRFTEAYMWLLLADWQGHEIASYSLGRLEKHMTEQQLLQAEQMAREHSTVA